MVRIRVNPNSAYDYDYTALYVHNNALHYKCAHNAWQMHALSKVLTNNLVDFISFCIIASILLNSSFDSLKSSHLTPADTVHHTVASLHWTFVRLLLSERPRAASSDGCICRPIASRWHDNCSHISSATSNTADKFSQQIPQPNVNQNHCTADVHFFCLFVYFFQANITDQAVAAEEVHLFCNMKRLCNKQKISIFFTYTKVNWRVTVAR